MEALLRGTHNEDPLSSVLRQRELCRNEEHPQIGAIDPRSSRAISFYGGAWVNLTVVPRNDSRETGF